MYYLEIIAVVSKYRDNIQKLPKISQLQSTWLEDKFASKIDIKLKPTLLLTTEKKPNNLMISIIRKGLKIQNYIKQLQMSTHTYYNSVDFKSFTIKDNSDPHI